MSPDRPASAGSAYFVRPAVDPAVDLPPGEHPKGPGVLVLHSWWGLTPWIKSRCDELGDAGFVVLAPDLVGGALPETAAEAQFELGESDPNETAALILSSIVTLRSQTDQPDAPVAIVGFSMGASWALWAATRQPGSVKAVVAYYGTQDIDFADLQAPVLAHFTADGDDLVSSDDVTEMHAHLLLLDKAVQVHHYEGTDHFFAEDSPAGSFDPEAEALAWQRTLEFLRYQSSSQ